jgi:SHS2 domain-containing protein
MPTTGFEFVEHTADWAVHVYGADLTELLINAAHAMSSLLVAHPDAIPADRNLEFELEAVDREGLLVEWLTELAYWAESEMLLFR